MGSRFAAVLLMGLVAPVATDAQKTSPQPAPGVGTPTATVPAPRQDAAPSVKLETLAPASVNLGQPLTYAIVVRNVGPVAVYHVRVDDRLPANVRYRGADPQPTVRGDQLSWELGELPAGTERRLKVEVEPTREGELTAQATVTYSSSADFRTQVTKGRLKATKKGPETIAIGEPAPFVIEVSNIGTGPVSNVVIRDRLPMGLQHPSGDVIEADLGTLAAGQTKSVTLQTTAAQPGRYVNEVTVTGDGGLETSAQTVVVVTQPVLSFRKTGPAQRFLGREAEFDLEVYNSGTGPATNVRVVDPLPEGLEFAAASDNGVYDPATRRVTWNLGALAAGQRRGLTLKVIAQKVGDWTNKASVQGDRVPEVPAEATIHLEGVPALMLEVVDLDDPVEVGNETSYEIRVVNQGSCPTINLVIVATLPAGLEGLDAVGPTGAHLRGSQITFDPLPRLAARADALYRVKVRGVRPGDWRFRVQMSSDQMPAPVLEEESTRVYDDQER
ncbi:MAG: DUF11 domain-containing protein [Gemmataceae bacterium]|nr:DUF11 domain-containing protein [Gemmataceae bacterium]